MKSRWWVWGHKEKCFFVGYQSQHREVEGLQQRSGLATVGMGKRREEKLADCWAIYSPFSPGARAQFPASFSSSYLLQICRFPSESEATSTQTHNPQLVSNLKSNLLRNSFIFKAPHFWLIPNAMGYLMQWASLSFLISQSAWLIEAIVSFVCHCIVPLSSDNKKPYWWNCRVSLK